MGRTKAGLIDGLAVLPWPVGVIFGIGGFILVRFRLPALLQGNPFGLAVVPVANLMSWFLLVVGLLGALMSWVGQRQRRRLLDAQQGLDSIAALGWRHFEQLVGEAFRRQGYMVEETGLGGADGGIDLILRKDGGRVLVQCKQWRRRQIPVNVVREMYGLLAHHNADAVKIACVGTFTRDAATFAHGKPIELIGGEELVRMIRDVQYAPTQAKRPVESVAHAPAASAPVASLDCPRCGKTMVERSNRKTGQKFWGCVSFPACRGVR
jgi:restriction system protein